MLPCKSFGSGKSRIMFKETLRDPVDGLKETFQPLTKPDLALTNCVTCEITHFVICEMISKIPSTSSFII